MKAVGVFNVLSSRYQILSVRIPPCGCSPYRDLWVPWYNFTKTPQQYWLHFLNILSRYSDVFLTKSQYMTFMSFKGIIQPKMTLSSFPHPRIISKPVWLCYFCGTQHFESQWCLKQLVWKQTKNRYFLKYFNFFMSCFLDYVGRCSKVMNDQPVLFL